MGPNRTIPLHPIEPPPYAWHTLGMDYIGPLPLSNKGNRFILSIIDYFTKYPIAIPLRSQRAEELIQAFRANVVRDHGAPRVLISDQGTSFVSEAFQTFLKTLGIEHRQSAPYHPQANGQVERWNQTLKMMLQPLVDEAEETWDDYVDLCVTTYRATPNTATGDTPFFLMHARDYSENVDSLFAPKLPTQSLTGYAARLYERLQLAWKEAGLRIVKAQAMYKSYYDRRAKPRKFQPGDLVLSMSKKRISRKGLAPKFSPLFDKFYRVISDEDSNVSR